MIKNMWFIKKELIYLVGNILMLMFGGFLGKWLMFFIGLLILFFECLSFWF